MRTTSNFSKAQLTLSQEYGGYVADITRTWPNSGKFTDPQRELYEAILRVQRTCVSLCREDADTTLDKIHRIAEVGLRDELKSLGFDVSGSVSFCYDDSHLSTTNDR